MLYVCFLLIFVFIVAYYRFYAFPPKCFYFELHFKGATENMFALYLTVCVLTVYLYLKVLLYKVITWVKVMVRGRFGVSTYSYY